MRIALTMALAAALAAAVYGCARMAGPDASFSGISTLRGADAAATDTAPEAKAYAGKRPGSGQSIARSFREQPPLVPHAIDNFDEITVSDNQCLECHGVDTAAAKKAPRVADSHLLGSGQHATLRMDRYQCNSCHVPQVDAPPLVRNTFVGTAPPTRP